MNVGKPFEVTHEEYERSLKNGGYMAGEDIRKHFDDSILMGYGLYSCKIHKTEDGRFICTYLTGSSCD